MDANKIIGASLLDILFEGKNKAYGAYELRKSYNKRISVSLVITGAAIVIVIIGAAIVNSFSAGPLKHMKEAGLVTRAIPSVQPPLPRPVLPPPPHVKTVADPPPIIVRDDHVITPPPGVQQIIDARIDIKTTDGITDIGIPDPPSNITGSQVLATVPQKEKEDTIFMGVQIEACFRGGAAAWSKYVSKAIEGSLDEFTPPDFGTCIVKFVVDKTGEVSQVEATTMKGSKLAEITTNAIRKGPKWIPAQQNGSYVNAYRFQPVTLTSPDQ